MKIVQFILFMAILTSCQSDYEQYAKRELNSGIRNDSLFMGLFMGDTKKEFYAICWDLNKKKVISAGSGNRYARYLEPLDSTMTIAKRKQIDFFGIFDKEEVMHGMEMIIQYTAWAPWNTKSHAKALAFDLQEHFIEQYGGNEFITIEPNKDGIKSYVKIDGNRQVLITPKGNKDVLVKIEDLYYKLQSK